MPTKKFSFEKKLTELEQILSHLENVDIELEKSLEEYKKGMAIADELKKYLTEFENKVKILTKEEK